MNYILLTFNIFVDVSVRKEGRKEKGKKARKKERKKSSIYIYIGHMPTSDT